MHHAVWRIDLPLILQYLLVLRAESRRRSRCQTLANHAGAPDLFADIQILPLVVVVVEDGVVVVYQGVVLQTEDFPGADL